MSSILMQAIGNAAASALQIVAPASPLKRRTGEAADHDTASYGLSTTGKMAMGALGLAAAGSTLWAAYVRNLREEQRLRRRVGKRSSLDESYVVDKISSLSDGEMTFF